jgi:hypothetical protein
MGDIHSSEPNSEATIRPLAMTRFPQAALACRLAIFAMVARLQPVAACTADCGKKARAVAPSTGSVRMPQLGSCFPKAGTPLPPASPSRCLRAGARPFTIYLSLKRRAGPPSLIGHQSASRSGAIGAEAFLQGSPGRACYLRSLLLLCGHQMQ